MGKKKRVRHIALIGMPSAGKTKVGKRLAARLGYDFVDIDDRIREHCGTATLQELVDALSPDEFAALESRVAIETVKNLAQSTVIATGGSMVYHEKAMKVFRQRTHIIHLWASFDTIARRIARKPNRGIVFAPGETLKGLYARRMPLYERWAHRTVSANGNRTAAAKALAKDLQREKFF